MELPEFTQAERAAYQHLRLEVIRALSTREPYAPIHTPGFIPTVQPLHALAAQMMGGDDGPSLMVSLLVLVGLCMHSEAAAVRHMALLVADKLAHRHALTHAADWAELADLGEVSA